MSGINLTMASKEDSSEEESNLVHSPANKDDATRSNTAKTIFNLGNSIIGAGIIATPYAISRAGFALGIILLIFVAGLTDYSLLLLIQASQLSGKYTYRGLMGAAFGRVGSVTMLTMQLVYPFINMISYNIVIGDTITKIMKSFDAGRISNVLTNRMFIISSMTLLLTLPLSLYRNITKLSKWGVLGLTCIVVVIVLIGVRLKSLHIPPTGDAFNVAEGGVTTAVGIIAFSFACPHNVHLIYDSMKTRTEANWKKVAHITLLICTLFTMLVGLLGYATFTGNCQGNLLENYCTKDVMMTGARFLFAIKVVMTYPVQVFVMRQVLEESVLNKIEANSTVFHVLTTLCLVGLALGISLCTDCLGVVLELNGVLIVSPLMFIFPPLAVLQLADRHLLSCLNVPLIATVIFGILVSLIGCIMALYNVIQGDFCMHGREPGYCLEPWLLANGTVSYLSENNYTMKGSQ